MQFSEFQAGRVLDELIAERIMGCKQGRTDQCPCYSTDIAAAIQVMEKLVSPNTLYVFSTGNPRAKWYCGCLEFDDYAMKVSLEEGEWGTGRTGVFAETAPLAICLAALQVITRSLKKHPSI